MTSSHDIIAIQIKSAGKEHKRIYTDLKLHGRVAKDLGLTDLC